MVAYAKEFLERCEKLKEELGGSVLAVRVSRQVVMNLNSESLEELRTYRQKVGVREFENEVTDLRHVGSMGADLLLGHLGPPPVEEDTIR